MIKAFKGVAKQAVSRDELIGAVQQTLPLQCRHRQVNVMGLYPSKRSSEANRCACRREDACYQRLRLMQGFVNYENIVSSHLPTSV